MLAPIPRVEVNASEPARIRQVRGRMKSSPLTRLGGLLLAAFLSAGPVSAIEAAGGGFGATLPTGPANALTVASRCSRGAIRCASSRFAASTVNEPFESPPGAPTYGQSLPSEGP